MVVAQVLRQVVHQQLQEQIILVVEEVEKVKEIQEELKMEVQV